MSIPSVPATTSLTVSEADPRARGSVIGSALAGPIGANVQRYLGYFAALGLSSDQVQEYGVAALDPISTWAPALGEELLGIAEGADLPVWQVAALNARTEIIAVARRLAADSGQAPATVAECSTSVFLLDRHPPRTIQTWDWLDTVRPDKVVLRLTGGRHTVVVFTEAGIVGKVGVNSAGLGVHLNMLSHLTDGVGMGVPVHVVARHLLDDAASLRRALVLAHSADVSASTVLTVSSWDGPDGQRYKRQDGTTTTLYIGGVEILIQNGLQTARRYVAGVALQTVVGGLGRVNTNGDGDDCARKSPTWRSRPNNSLPLNTACPGSVATSA